MRSDRIRSDQVQSRPDQDPDWRRAASASFCRLAHSNPHPYLHSRTPSSSPSLIQVTDLQAAIVYLASEVSDYMVGHNLVIEGGQSLW